MRIRKDKDKGMYRKMNDMNWETVKTQFVPYDTWSNRGESEIKVGITNSLGIIYSA